MSAASSERLRLRLSEATGTVTVVPTHRLSVRTRRWLLRVFLLRSSCLVLQFHAKRLCALAEPLRMDDRVQRMRRREHRGRAVTYVCVRLDRQHDQCVAARPTTLTKELPLGLARLRPCSSLEDMNVRLGESGGLQAPLICHTQPFTRQKARSHRRHYSSTASAGRSPGPRERRCISCSRLGHFDPVGAWVVAFGDGTLTCVRLSESPPRL